MPCFWAHSCRGGVQSRPRGVLPRRCCVLARWASRCLEALRIASEGARGSCDETRARTGCQLSRKTAKTSYARQKWRRAARVLSAIFAASTGAKQPSETPRRRLGPKHACSHASVYMPLANSAIAGASKSRRAITIGNCSWAPGPLSEPPRQPPQRLAQRRRKSSTQTQQTQDGHALQ